MTDLKVRLLPPRIASGAPSDIQVQQTPVAGRSIFHGPEHVNLKKRGPGIRSWIRIDTVGTSQVLEVDKGTVMRRCDLPARDLRLLDPLFVYPSTILGRDRAIVLNLEQIRCIITAHEVLLLNSLDSHVLQYVAELQRRLATSQQSDVTGSIWCSTGGKPMELVTHAGASKFSSEASMFSSQDVQHCLISDMELFNGSSADRLCFEFKAFEVALEAACTFLDTQASELEEEAYPALDELMSKVSTLNLERVRRLKSRLVALTRRVQKVRDEIEQLMDDDRDMAEMYLTRKRYAVSRSLHAQTSTCGFNNIASGGSISVMSSSFDNQILNMGVSGSESPTSSVSDDKDVEDLEMLLEAYFSFIDGTLNKLISLKEYIDDTEDFINIKLDNVRNQLIQFELLLTTATFVVAMFGVVTGVFGMNIPIALFDEPKAFKWVLVISGAFGSLVFYCFIWFFKRRQLMPL